MANPIHPYAVYDSKDAAALLRVDVITVQRYIRSGKLQATRLGKVYRITGQSILDLMSLDTESITYVQDRIRKLESTNYIKSKSFLLSNEKGKNYMEQFSLSADTLFASLEPKDTDNEDALTIKYLGSRAFNTAMAAYRDALSGYYQVSFANQRDLLELQFLLDYFRTERDQIKIWREANNETRYQKFSPAKIRKFLDDRDGFTERKREKKYKMFCEYATHASYQGFRLIANSSNLIEIGPFYDEGKLLNTLYELSLNFGYVVVSITPNLTVQSPKVAQLWIRHGEMFDKVFNFDITKNEKFQEAKENINKIIQQLNESALK